VFDIVIIVICLIDIVTAF